MKTYKHFLILAIVFILGESCIAQDKQLSEEQKGQVEAQLEVYYENLDLTKEQKPKFKEITLRYGKEMFALNETENSRFWKYKSFKSISRKKNEEMSTLLSAKQFKRYLKIQEEQRQKMKDQIRKEN